MYGYPRLIAQKYGESTQTGTIAMTPQTSEPSNPQNGEMYLADRVNWDPLSLGSGGAYYVIYLGSSSGWGAITDQLD